MINNINYIVEEIIANEERGQELVNKLLDAVSKLLEQYELR